MPVRTRQMMARRPASGMGQVVLKTQLLRQNDLISCLHKGLRYGSNVSKQTPVFEACASAVRQNSTDTANTIQKK